MYLTSNGPRAHLAHVAVQREQRGAKGTLFGTYYVALCTGRQVGGAWGQSVTDTVPADCTPCRRCAAKQQQS